MSTMDFLTALEESWLARRRHFSPHTVSDYSVMFKRLVKYVSSQPLEETTARGGNGFFNHLKFKSKLSD